MPMPSRDPRAAGKSRQRTQLAEVNGAGRGSISGCQLRRGRLQVAARDYLAGASDNRQGGWSSGKSAFAPAI